MILCLLLAWVGAAGAVDNRVVAPRRGGPQGFLDLAQDLTSEDKGDRQLAARALRRQVRIHLRDAEGREGSLSQFEALAALQDNHANVAPRCLKVLDKPDLVGPCADILGLLETPQAAAPLRAALQTEARRGPRRRIERALARISTASTEEP